MISPWAAFLFRWRGITLGLWLLGLWLTISVPIFSLSLPKYFKNQQKFMATQKNQIPNSTSIHGEIPKHKAPLRIRSWWWLALVPAIALRLSAANAIGLHTRGQTLASPQLVEHGIYSRMRHPLYLANFFAGLGVVGMCGLSYLPAAFFLGALLLHQLTLMRLEDAFLIKSWGEKARLYQRNVPAWGWAIQAHTASAFSFQPIMNSSPFSMTAWIRMVWQRQGNALLHLGLGFAFTWALLLLESKKIFP